MLVEEVVRVRKALSALERACRRPVPRSASKIHFWLNSLSLETLIYLLALTKTEAVRRAISLFVTKLRHQRVELDGHALAGLGLTPGVEFKQILNRLLEARLDGEISSRQEEVALVEKFYL